MKARRCSSTLAGQEPATIFVPCTSVYLLWLQQISETFQISLAAFPEQVLVRPPAHKLFGTVFVSMLKPK